MLNFCGTISFCDSEVIFIVGAYLLAGVLGVMTYRQILAQKTGIAKQPFFKSGLLYALILGMILYGFLVHFVYTLL